jgi:methionyl-tRNA formyltransferase
MRLAFMGTPEFAVPALDALVAAGHDVVAVYTQPARPGNRGRIEPTPVAIRAAALGLAVRTPERLKGADEQAAFAALGLDAAVVAAYGLILPRAVLGAPRLGCFNIHASLLPRWRGAAPIQRAILAGDTETGVTIMQMAAGLDTGDMLLKAATPIAGKTAGALTGELADMGARLMVDALERLPSLKPEAQDEEEATYAAKINKAEARIDWHRPAADVERLVRAMHPSPGAWFETAAGRVKLLAAALCEGDGRAGTVLDGGRIACGTGAIRPRIVQPAGRAAMPADAWWNGARLAPGTLLP